MAGGGEKTATDQACPEAIAAREKLRRQRKTKIENLELVQGCGDVGHMSPTSWNLLQNYKKAENRSADVQNHLHYVGPNNRRQAAFKGVEQGQENDYDNRDYLSGSQNDRDHQRYREHTNAFGQGAQNEKCARCQPADTLAKTPAHQFVGGKHFSAEVLRQKQCGDENTRQQVTEHHLQKLKISVEREGRRADDSEGAGFGRHDGKSDGPPRGRVSAQEIVAQCLLRGAEARPEPSDPNEINADDAEVKPSHGNRMIASCLPAIVQRGA